MRIIKPSPDDWVNLPHMSRTRRTPDGYLEISTADGLTTRHDGPGARFFGAILDAAAESVDSPRGQSPRDDLPGPAASYDEQGTGSMGVVNGPCQDHRSVVGERPGA